MSILMVHDSINLNALRTVNARGGRKEESNDSPEIPDRREELLFPGTTREVL